MATDTDVQEQAAATSGSGRIRPHQLALALGILVGIGVVWGSWLLATIFDQHSEDPVHREVLGNIPDAWVIVFYTVTSILVLYGSWNFSLRVRNWERGAPDKRETNRATVKRRRDDFLRGVYMQTLLRDPAAGIMHSLLYFGFLGLFAVTTASEIDHQLPTDLKFLEGDVYRGYALFGDVVGVMFVAGVLMAIYRRYIQRVYRIRIKSKPEHALILGTFLVLGLSGFGSEVFRIALVGRPEFEQWAVVSWPLSGLVDGWPE